VALMPLYAQSIKILIPLNEKEKSQKSIQVYPVHLFEVFSGTGPGTD